MEDATSSPFVFFNHGTAFYPPNNLHEATKAILAEIGTLPPADAIKELAKYRPLIPFTLHHVLAPVCRAYQQEAYGFKNVEALLLMILDLMTQAPPETAWQSVRDEVLANIDVLSGWSFSWQKEHGEKEPITQGEDGLYCMKSDDGTLIQIIGAKLLPETRLDFITDRILRPYGPVRRILVLFSLFAISNDFRSHPDAYQSSVRLVLGDGSVHDGPYKWYRMQSGQPRTSRWRPYSNLCDPEWLAEELMNRLTSPLKGDPWKDMIARYKNRVCRLDEDCHRQMDYVLDSHLIIGDEDEIYFKFEGRTFRWINGTPESAAILSVGVKDEDPQHKKESEAINRLLSTLVWLHHSRIVNTGGAGGPRRALPLTWAPRMSGGTKISAEEVQNLTPRARTDRDWLALALHKEGKNSNSVFYRYLSYWKVIEVAIPDKNDRWTWINANVTRAISGREPLALGEAKSAAEYLDYSGRCAIVHVFRDPIADPDDVADQRRISQDVYVVEELARLAMVERMGINR